ncbi:unnamed protein product [Brassica rapa]|uniref:FBD domain-containing protein n=1 Tax=Brassica campestris TaxID=3711 RepID=A0A3P5ZCC1_BRACM|nr:F-box/LRR-repeat protein At3g03030-like [Brassica napus]CAG7890727.1 unnamed protein product [Brassica rapa]VDC78096.1 unnamed protein product [Brassica rapa]
MDLLSALPDDVRSHILSFLTTKEAALTSVLSKKWRYMFTRVPVLDVDDSNFLHPRIFMAFVDRVLSLQGDSPIERFTLKCEDGVDPERVNGWICNALRRGVSELDLSINFEDEDYLLPREMFVSETLVKLKLTSEFGLHWWVGADATFLPLLKTLRIASEMVSMDCDVNMERFLACFPVLEEAELISMDWVDPVDTVSSSTLKKLTVHATGMKTVQNPKSISFDAPNLRFLAYSDWVAEDYPVVKLSKLDVARIALSVTDDQTRKIRGPRKYLSEGDVVRQFGNVVKLMIGIRDVRELHLHPDTLEVLSQCCDSMPVFNNLKMLIITSDEDRGWQAMPALLRNCPQLEFLLIKGLVHHVTKQCGDACDCIHKKHKGRSLKSCPVKMFVIRGFTGTMKEMNMIEHFLDYFPCLEEMNIYIEEDVPTPLKYDRQFAERVLEMIEEFDYSYKCNVQLLDE